MATAKKTKESFEKALAQLETVVTSLEDGELSLEDSIKAFEQGNQLVKLCETKLNEARKKVEVLMGDKEENFPWDEDDAEGDDQ